MDQPAPQTPDQSHSPSSLPGRDPTADADTSLIRKRPRLSHEQETPPATNDDSSNSATLSDFPGSSAHSPSVVEIPQMQSNDPPEVSIIMSGDEIPDLTCIDTFPFRADQFPTPELAAEAVADLFRRQNEVVDDKELFKLHDWLDKHLSATEAKFKAALDQGSTSDASEICHVYSDNTDFWNHIVACFAGLAGRSAFNQKSEYCGESGTLFFESLIHSFVRLGERLLMAEVIILTQANARRDSARPIEQPKHTLLFTSWISALHMLIARERSFLQRSSSTLGLESDSVRRNVILRFQTCAMIILVDLVTHILAKPGTIKSPFLAIRFQLYLCREVLAGTGDVEDNMFEGLYRQSLRLYGVIRTMGLSTLPKIHPDDLPPQFHNETGVALSEILQALLLSGYLSASSAFGMILKEVADHDVHLADMIAGPSAKQQNAPESDGPEKGFKEALIQEIIPSSINAGRLEYYNALAQSNIVELRILGVDHLGRFVYEIWTKRVSALIEYSSRFIHAKGLMPYIFGPQSHAAVISRSYHIVGFLATTRTMTRTAADALWSTFIKYQQSDIAQHASIILFQTIPNMDSTQLIYFCEKYSNLESIQFTRQVEKILETLLTSLPTSHGFTRSDCFEAACACISLLGTIGSPNISPATQNTQLDSMKKMLHALPSPSDVQEQLKLVDMCAGPIKSHSDLATGYIQALFCILCMQSNPAVPTSDILSRLSLQDCTQELLHFVQSVKRSSGKVASNALVCRIDLTLYILAISDPATTASAEKYIWDHLVGEDAVASETREIAWAALTSNFERLNMGISGFYQKCVSQYLPSLSPELITHGISALFSLEERRQASHPEVLMPLKEDLIRFAVRCPSHQTSLHLISAILSQLFDGKAFAVPSLAFREQIDLVRRCVRMLSLRDISSSRAANFLRFALSCSIRYEAKLEQMKKATAVQDESTAATQSESDKMQIPIRIHQGNADPKNHVLTVNKSANCSELNAAISSEIGSENYTVISSGQKVNISNEPQQSIQTLGLKEGNTLIVQKHSTLESVGEDALKNNGKTTVERELLSHLNVLYGALDDLSSTGEFAYQVLEYLQFPGPIRSLITSTDTSFDVIFPPAAPWKMRMSIEVISKQLQEQIAVGLADEKFLLRSIHLLIDLLDRDECTQNFPVVLRAIDVLLALLRERPVKDNPEAYFKDPERFVNRTISMLSLLHQEITDLDKINARAHAVHTLYLCLLEGVLLSSSLRATFVKMDDIVEVHRNLLTTGNSYLSQSIPNSIVAALRDGRMSSDIKACFWDMFVKQLIPAAQERPSSCKGVYDLGAEILIANQEKSQDEATLRMLIDYFAAYMLDTDHLESQGSTFVDYRVQGLADLIRYCVDSLRYLKKPLNLRNLGPDLFKKLLFPPVNVAAAEGGEGVPRSIVTATTRKALYRLIRVMCDDLQTLMELSDLCMKAGAIDVPSEWTFPGPENFVRSGCGYAGLDNLAQTCYMNSLIQQLFMNINFRKFVLDTQIVDRKRQSILHEFKVAFAHMQNSQGPTYRPEALARALDVDVMVQDDAHIFFTTLIGKLEDSMPDEDAKKTLKTFFGGVNKSQTIGSCKHVSESHDEYFNLSLVVKDKASLAESLDEYTQGAALEGGDKFKCTTCGTGEGTYVDAVRRTALDHVPDNLVLGLKRFRYETYDGGTKVNDRFEFPERIDVSPYKLQRLAGVDEQSKPDVFQLVGVVVHSGTLQFGHYWSYAAERGYTGPGPAPWFRLEDSTVTPSSIDEVICETSGGPLEAPRGQVNQLRADNAYVLFYQRVTSLEDSVKCLVSDHAASATSTHPKVALPQDIAVDIACDNVKHIHLLNLFSLDHLNFVLDLAARLEDIRDSDPSRTTTAESNILGLLFQYLVRVFSRSPAVNLVEHTALMAQKLACSRPEYAAEVLDNLFTDLPGARFSREHLIVNRKSNVRKAASRLVLSCLEYLRKADPERYMADAGASVGDLVRATRIGHVARGLENILEMLPDSRLAWPDYFDLVGQIADFGSRETEIMLSLGFLQWCIDTVVIQWDTGAQKSNPVLWFHVQNNRRYAITSVVDCIYTLLYKYVDLRGGTVMSGNFDESRRTNSGMLLLAPCEHAVLTWKGEQGAGWFMRSCLVQSARPKSEPFSDWNICKLAVMLTDVSKTSIEIVGAAYHAILSLIPYSPGTHAEVLGSVLVAQRLDGPAKASMMEILVSTLNSSRLRDAPEAAIAYTRILNIVYPSVSVLILRHLVPLVEGLVMCECDEAERETARWLRDQVLAQTCLSKPYTQRNVRLYHQKFKVVKRLVHALGGLLKGPSQQGYDPKLYEAAIRGFKDCGEFLTNAVASVKDDMADWLSKESTEIDADTDNAMSEMIEDMVDEFSDGSELMVFIDEGLQMVDEWTNEDSNSLGFRQNRSGRSEAEEETDADLVESEDEEVGGEFDDMSNA